MASNGPAIKIIHGNLKIKQNCFLNYFQMSIFKIMTSNFTH